MRSIRGTAIAVLIAAALIAIGLIWDIAWHRSIGRDTFWSPPHLMEYLAALIVGTSCGWLILRTTFTSAVEERDRTVRFWGFRGPLGAWIAVWGSLAMLVSAPFDDWWHNAYGLDVKIVSPPHMLLGAGMTGIVIGAWLMSLAVQNRSPVRGRRDAMVFAAASAILLLLLVTITMEYTAFPNLWRGRVFYFVAAAAYPLILAAASRSGRLRWPATAAAALYMLVSLGLSYLLQNVPATPRLAPINNPVTHLVAAPFPIVLVIPALVLDLLHRRAGDRRDWRLSLAMGAGFVAGLFAVSWPLAGFLLSEAAQHPVFLADNWDFSAVPGQWRYEYWDRLAEDGGRSVGKVILIATLLAAVSSRLGLWLGSWMRKVQR